jgi:hypothetical protein
MSRKKVPNIPIARSNIVDDFFFKEQPIAIFN